MSAAGHDLIVVQCLDPAEREFTFEKATHFEDSETGRELYVDPSSVRKSYLRRLEEHLDGIRTICTKVGAGYHLFSTDYPLELALSEFVQRRQG